MELIRKPDQDDGLVVEVSDGQAIFGVDPESVTAGEPEPVAKAPTAAAQAPKTAELDDELAAAQKRLEAKRNARVKAKAPTAADTAREELNKAGRLL
jgi:hypothetical protein